MTTPAPTTEAAPSSATSAATSAPAKTAPKAARPAAKRTTKSKQPIPVGDLTPSQQIAAAITREFGDLIPSVRRIMEAGLGEPGRMAAITGFRESLGVPGAPLRHPLAAIEHGRLADEQATELTPSDAPA